MKNFPHAFSKLDHFEKSLKSIHQLIESKKEITTENIDKLLVSEKIYKHKDTNDIDKKLNPDLKSASDALRTLKLLSLVTIKNNIGELSGDAIQLISTYDDEVKKEIWRNAFLNLELSKKYINDNNVVENRDSHPYFILLKLINDHKENGIETKKLSLALEAKDDSEEEYQRILKLSKLSIEEICKECDITESKVRNGVKVFPSIAAELNHIEKKGKFSFLNGNVNLNTLKQQSKKKAKINLDESKRTTPGDYLSETTSKGIAKTPNFTKDKNDSMVNKKDAIEKTEKRTIIHHEKVTSLAEFFEKNGFKLYYGRPDIIAIKDDVTFLIETKSILDSIEDQEDKTVSAMGQLLNYSFLYMHKKLKRYPFTKVIHYTQKPLNHIFELCEYNNILVLWNDGDDIKMYDPINKIDVDFNPNNY